MRQGRPVHSVVVPFFNEAEGLPEFLPEFARAVDALSALSNDTRVASCEVLLIDDGSTDATASLLAAACARRDGWRVIEMEHNCGQAAALYTGLRLAAGERIVLLDGDGQNDPADIPRVLALLDGGADLSVGVRARRQDSWTRRCMSRVANAIRRRLLQDGVRDTGCGLKALRREVVEALVPLRTLYSSFLLWRRVPGFAWRR